MLKHFVVLLVCLVLLPNTALCNTLSAEDAHAIVDSLFVAAAGVDTQDEATLRKGMSSDTAALRDTQLSGYRKVVYPWLLASLLGEQSDPNAISSAAEAMLSNEVAQHYLSLLTTKGATTIEEQLSLTHVAFLQWANEINHIALRITNPAYACWIYLPGTPIDYPVVHSDNNKTYLNHMFDGTRNASGTLFIDYRNLPNFQDPNTLVYGHHMRNGSMFGTLPHFNKPGYAAAHPYLLVMTSQSLLLAELFAGYVTSSDDHCYDIAISDAEDLLHFEETAQRKSSFTIPMEFSPSDRLLTLSTCAYSFENARYILIGKLNILWTLEEPMH